MQGITTSLFPLNLFCLVLSFQHILQHKEERSPLRTLPWFGQPTSFNTNLAYGKGSRVHHCERIGPWRSIQAELGTASKLPDLAMTTNHTHQITVIFLLPFVLCVIRPPQGNWPSLSIPSSPGSCQLWEDPGFTGPEVYTIWVPSFRKQKF